MRKNVRCYACIYCRTCDKKQEEKCSRLDYALLTTPHDKEMCDLLCGKAEEDDDEMEEN